MKDGEIEGRNKWKVAFMPTVGSSPYITQEAYPLSGETSTDILEKQGLPILYIMNVIGYG